MAALDYAKAQGGNGGFFVFNLGTSDPPLEWPGGVGPSLLGHSQAWHGCCRSTSSSWCQYPLARVMTRCLSVVVCLVGTGVGYSVLQMIAAMEKASGTTTHDSSITRTEIRSVCGRVLKTLPMCMYGCVGVCGVGGCAVITRPQGELCGGRAEARRPGRGLLQPRQGEESMG